MATEPDDIVVDAATPANDDRVQELVGGHRSNFEAKQSIAQQVKKAPGDCRMVVEIPFNFSKEFLKARSDEYRFENFRDGVDYLRELKKQWEHGDIGISDLLDLSAHHSHNGVRVEAAK